MDAPDLPQAQGLHHLTQEVQPFLEGIDKGHPHPRIIDLQGQSRKTGPCSHVHNGVVVEGFPVVHQQGVHHMLHRHFLRIRNGGQVQAFVGFQQQVPILLELVQLPFRKREAGGLRRLFQGFPVTHASSPFRRWVSRYTISTLMSAGDTPEIRLAWPMDTGRCLVSFSMASEESSWIRL